MSNLNTSDYRKAKAGEVTCDKCQHSSDAFSPVRCLFNPEQEAPSPSVYRNTTCDHAKREGSES